MAAHALPGLLLFGFLHSPETLQKLADADATDKVQVRPGNIQELTPMPYRPGTVPGPGPITRPGMPTAPTAAPAANGPITRPGMPAAPAPVGQAIPAPNASAASTSAGLPAQSAAASTLPSPGANPPHILSSLETELAALAEQAKGQTPLKVLPRPSPDTKPPHVLSSLETELAALAEKNKSPAPAATPSTKDKSGIAKSIRQKFQEHRKNRSMATAGQAAPSATSLIPGTGAAASAAADVAADVASHVPTPPTPVQAISAAHTPPTPPTGAPTVLHEAGDAARNAAWKAKNFVQNNKALVGAGGVALGAGALLGLKHMYDKNHQPQPQPVPQQQMAQPLVKGAASLPTPLDWALKRASEEATPSVPTVTATTPPSQENLGKPGNTTAQWSQAAYERSQTARDEVLKQLFVNASKASRNSAELRQMLDSDRVEVGLNALRKIAYAHGISTADATDQHIHRLWKEADESIDFANNYAAQQAARNANRVAVLNAGGVQNIPKPPENLGAVLANARRAPPPPAAPMGASAFAQNLRTKGVTQGAATAAKAAPLATGVGHTTQNLLQGIRNRVAGAGAKEQVLSVMKSVKHASAWTVSEQLYALGMC